MATPTYAVEVQFDGVNWTPLAGVLEIHAHRGRQTELAKWEAGTGSILLENDDGRFSPEQTGSAYYPNVKPMVFVRASATFASTTYWLGFGFIRRWQPVKQGDFHRVNLSYSDLYIVLSKADLNTTYAAQLSGARIGAVLNSISWPSGLRDLNAGQSTMPAITLANTKALSHIEHVLEAEDGQLWMAPSGAFTFRDRHARLIDSRSTTSQATFGGAAGLPYRLGPYEYDVDQVYNRVRATRTGGVEQSASDATSILAWWTSDYAASTGEFGSDEECARWCGWKLAQHKDPAPRLRQIQLEGGGDDNLWTQMLARDINDRVTVVNTFPGNLGLNRAFWIEGVDHDVTNGLRSHLTTWNLSVANPAAFGVWGSGLWGTAKWAY